MSNSTSSNNGGGSGGGRGTGRKRTGYDPSRLILDTAFPQQQQQQPPPPSRLGSLRSHTPDLSLSSSSSSSRRTRVTPITPTTSTTTTSSSSSSSTRFRPNVAGTRGPTTAAGAAPRFMPNIPGPSSSSSSSSSDTAAHGRRAAAAAATQQRESKFRPNLRGAKSRRGGHRGGGGRGGRGGGAMPLPSLARGGGLMTQQFLGSMGLGGMDDSVPFDHDDDDDDMDVKEGVERLEQKHSAQMRAALDSMFEGMRQPPIVVPAPGSLEEEVFDTATSSSNSVQAMQLDEAEARATRDLFRYNIERLMSDDQLFFIQLPSSLPIASSRRKAQSGADAGKGKKEGKTALSKDEEYESIWTSAFESTLTRVPAGYMGEMIVHKSGKTKLKLGGSNSQLMMDVLPGSDFSFLEHVVAISAENAQLFVLGEVAKRMTVVPSIEDLLDDQK